MTHVIISNGTCTRPNGSGVEHGFLIGERVKLIEIYQEKEVHTRAICENVKGLRQIVMLDHIQKK